MAGGCFTKADDAKQYSLKELSVSGYPASTPGKTVWEARWYKDVEGKYVAMTTDEVNAVKIKAGQGLKISQPPSRP